MYPKDRIESPAARRQHLAETDRAHAIEHELRALRAFVGRHELAAVEFGACMAQQVRF